MQLGEYQNALRYLLKAYGMVCGGLVKGISQLEHDIGTCYEGIGNRTEAGNRFTKSSSHG